MGFFTPRYLKEGPGVPKDAPQKKPIARFFELFGRKFTKLVVLNLFYCLFWIPSIAMEAAVYLLELPDYIPFFTTLLCMPLIGPATAGMTKILICFTEEKPVFMISDFMDAFKSNFKQATLAAVIDWCIVSLVWVSLNFYLSQADWGMLSAVPAGLTIAGGLLMLLANFYLMPMVVKLKLGLRDMLKNALLLAVAELKANAITLFWVLLIAVPCVLFFPLTLLFILPLALSLVGFIICFNSWPIIVRRCVTQEPEPEGGEPAEEQLFSDGPAINGQ